MLLFYGTRHYAKRNVVNRFGSCEHCGAHGALSSYDASVFFYLYFIPIIPLGQKRITDACPSCDRHYQSKLKDYTKTQEKELNGALAAMEADPNSADKAADAVAACIRYSDLERFKKMAPGLAAKHPRNPNVQGILGASYEYLGKSAEAEGYFRKAVELDGSPENRETLARNLIWQLKPREAEHFLTHILSARNKEKLGNFYFLVEAYRHLGKHKDALRILAVIESIEQPLAEDKDHQSVKASSESLQHRGDPVPSQTFLNKRGVAAVQGGSPPWLPWLVPAGIIGLALLIYLGLAFKAGMAREMWLVSGAQSRYTVTLNGEEHRLEPNSFKRIELPEGEIKMSFNGTGLPVPDRSVRFKTDFFSRPFKSPTVVLNPDGLAVVVREDMVYSSVSLDLDTDSDFSLFCGDSLYVINNIDYKFRDFPETINVSSSSSRVRKARVFPYRPDSGGDLVEAAYQAVGPDNIQAYLERYLLFSPSDVDQLYTYCRIAGTEPEKLVEFLRRGTERKPVMVDWHRMYQGAMDDFYPEHDTTGEYRRLLADNGQDPVYLYLTARLVKDRKKARKLFLQSEQGPQPIGFGHYALAYGDLSAGRFKNAQDHIESALEVMPDRSDFLNTYTVTLSALRRYDLLLEHVRKQRSISPSLAMLAGKEMEYLVLAGKVDEARRLRKEFVKQLVEEIGADDAASWSLHFDSVIAYLAGDAEGYVKAADQMDAESSAFPLAVWNRDAEAAAEILAKHEFVPYTDYLVAYCLAKAKGNRQVARRMLDGAIASLQTAGEHEMVAAEMLRGNAGLVRNELSEIEIHAAAKSLVAAALGLAQPELKEHCFSIAEQHNYIKTFPHRLIAEVTTRQH